MDEKKCRSSFKRVIFLHEGKKKKKKEKKRKFGLNVFLC